MKREITESLLGLLNDPRIHDLLRLTSRECLLWETFAKHPLPDSVDREQLWDLVTEIRRHQAMQVPIPTPQGNRTWYFMHQDMHARLKDIERYCRSDSDLHRELTDRQGSPFLVKNRIEEAIATSQLDGLDIDSEEARALLRLDYRPKYGGERLVLNTYRVIEDIDTYAGERFTPDLLRELYERIVDGVDLSSLTRIDERFALSQRAYRAALEGQTDRRLDLICAYANNDIGEPNEHAAVRALGLRGLMKQWQPLPDWNGNVASALFCLYCLKHDYPVLGYLPVCRAQLAWDDGRLRQPVVLAARLPKQHVDPAGNEEITPAVTIAVQLLHHELEALRRQVEASRLRDEEVLEALEGDRSLNHRQISVIGRALRHPSAEFSIRYHRINHGVVQATARSDLLSLVDRGYLTYEKRSRAFIFRAHPELATRLGAIAPQQT
ncbi:MAG: hypothetical protein JXA87_11715 [Thermoleophilia bacterium]|nr:hypothetical protein [Thermoleophilia bacterium]